MYYLPLELLLLKWSKSLVFYQGPCGGRMSIRLSPLSFYDVTMDLYNKFFHQRNLKRRPSF